LPLELRRGDAPSGHARVEVLEEDALRAEGDLAPEVGQGLGEAGIAEAAVAHVGPSVDGGAVHGTAHGDVDVHPSPGLGEDCPLSAGGHLPALGRGAGLRDPGPERYAEHPDTALRQAKHRMKLLASSISICRAAGGPARLVVLVAGSPAGAPPAMNPLLARIVTLVALTLVGFQLYTAALSPLSEPRPGCARACMVALYPIL